MNYTHHCLLSAEGCGSEKMYSARHKKTRDCICMNYLEEVSPEKRIRLVVTKGKWVSS